MKHRQLILIIAAVLVYSQGFTQKKAVPAVKPASAKSQQLTIEPGIGIHANFGTDFLLSGLVQWNLRKQLSLASHSSFNINNLFQRNFNGITTEYNYSINQKFGVGTSFYSKRSSHSFLLMAGIKFTSFKETLTNHEDQKVSKEINSVSPDYGLMYSLKLGTNKYFFSFRAYVPIYPWPTKDLSFNSLDGNMNNIALEFGIGIRIK